MPNAEVRPDLELRRTLVRRSRSHVLANTTEQGKATMEIPVSDYTDEAIWRQEVDNVILRRPQILGFGTEVAEPGDYKAATLAGVPVLVARGKDGVVRAFVNACRHRGTKVMADGCGHAARFVCPYHAWTYDAAGALVGVYQEGMFGDVERAARGLKPLACAERAGFIWGVLTPGIAMDLDAWLGGYGAALDDLELDQWHITEHRELVGPSWKVVFDGYLEGYHFNVLHKPSVGKDTKGTMVADQFGPHQRLIFAREGMDRHDSDQDPGEAIFPVHSIYPNVSVAGGYQDQILFSQVMPGATPATSVTQVTLMSRKAPLQDEAQQLRMKKYADYIFAVLKDEDFAAGMRIQATLHSGANETFLIGRNEYTLQHYHSWLRHHRAAPEPTLTVQALAG